MECVGKALAAVRLCFSWFRPVTRDRRLIILRKNEAVPLIQNCTLKNVGKTCHFI